MNLYNIIDVNCLLVVNGGTKISTETGDFILLVAFYILTCGAIFSDFVVWIFSRSQLENLLNEKGASSVTRFFCKPFCENEDSASISCSMLSILMTGVYFSYGIIKFDGWHSSVLRAVLLLAALLAAVPFMNIFSRLHTESILLGICRPLWFLIFPFRLISSFMVFTEKKIYSIFKEEEEEAEEDREEIIAMVTDGEHEGVVEENEREMIQNIFDLKNFDISDIMTPRTDICAINITESFEQAILTASEKGFSRIPVFGENRDDIKGIFYVKDALVYWNKEKDKTPQLKDILRRAVFVPETKSVGELMEEFLQQKRHMAIVLDEYGGTAGLVTIEDVVEEIVGEIQDEYDAEENELIENISDSEFIVDARFHVHDMNEKLGSKIVPETDDYETVGGFILDQLGHVPKVDESIVSEGIRFTVLSADDRKIEKIKVEKIPEEELEKDTEE